MLTLILLVVLGGGAGLLAVSLIDSRGLSRLLPRGRLPSLRGATGPGTPPAPSGGEEELVVVAEPEAPEAPSGPRPARAQRGAAAAVPPAWTAIEGPYRDVAVAPAWRQAVSLVALVVLVVLLGVAVAAVAGLAVGTAAELLDGAVG